MRQEARQKSLPERLSVRLTKCQKGAEGQQSLQGSEHVGDLNTEVVRRSICWRSS